MKRHRHTPEQVVRKLREGEPENRKRIWGVPPRKAAAGSVPSGLAVPPPGWYPDPAGIHEHRCWNGSAWASGVVDGELLGKDPLPPAPFPQRRRLQHRSRLQTLTLVATYVALFFFVGPFVSSGEASPCDLQTGAQHGQCIVEETGLAVLAWAIAFGCAVGGITLGLRALRRHRWYGEGRALSAGSAAALGALALLVVGGVIFWVLAATRHLSEAGWGSSGQWIADLTWAAAIGLATGSLLPARRWIPTWLARTG